MKMVWPIALVFLFPPFLKLGNSDSASPGQAINYGPFRSVSHIVMVVHPLKPDEKWSGPTITEAGSNFGIVSYGTGCAVSKDGHVLTNSHVAREGETLMVGGWGDAAKSLSAEVLKRDTKNDLALLNVKPPSEPPWITTFSPSESLIEGREVFLWAYLQTPGYFVQFVLHRIDWTLN